MTAFAEAVAKHRPVEAAVRVPMRGDLLAVLDQLAVEYREQKQADDRSNGEDKAPAIGLRMQQVREEMAASEVEFVFKAVSGDRYRQLVRENPPTPQEKAEADKANIGLYFGTSFIPALLAEACVSPEGSTVEDWINVRRDWSDGQFQRLWRECIAIQSGGAETPPKSVIAFAVPAESNPS